MEVVEASVRRASGADGSGCARRVARDKLDGSTVGQESPIEIEHPQEAAELAGGLRWRAVLQMRHPFLQWSGPLGCAEDALRWVHEDPVPLEPLEEGPQVLLVLLEGPGEDEDVIQVCKAEVESPQHLVHEALERLGGVTQAEGHVRELEKAKGSCDGGLQDVAGMDGYLVVSSHQVDV
jgi:hypothetical protein